MHPRVQKALNEIEHPFIQEIKNWLSLRLKQGKATVILQSSGVLRLFRPIKEEIKDE